MQGLLEKIGKNFPTGRKNLNNTEALGNFALA
jgi:hypothetical protein